MPRFFLDYEPDKIITVAGSDANHISRSLRMKIGDKITFCNKGTDYFCTISSMTAMEVVCSIDKKEQSKSEPDINLTLYQAVPKQDKLEIIIQKTVELGIYKIVPFLSKRCVSRPTKSDFEKKLERLNRISSEAAKQSGRGIVPEISSLMSFEQAVEDMSKNDVRLMCYENEGKRLSEIKFQGAKTIGIMIGSEGGFEYEEAELAARYKAEHIWLGERILRCETCPVAMSAIIMNLTGNM